MADTNKMAEPLLGILRRFLPLAILVIGLGVVLAFDLHRFLSFSALQEHREELQRLVTDYGIIAGLAFLAVYATVVAFSVPGGAILTITGGFLFGTWLGSLYVLFGATIGATAVFLAARTALGDMLRQKAGSAIKRMEAGFQENALNYMLVLRLVPLFPFWLVNLVPAFLGVPLRIYVIGTFFGIIPGTVVYASVGNGLGAIFAAGQTPDLGIIFKPEILGPILGLAVLAVIPVLYKRLKQRLGK